MDPARRAGGPRRLDSPHVPGHGGRGRRRPRPLAPGEHAPAARSRGRSWLSWPPARRGGSPRCASRRPPRCWASRTKARPSSRTRRGSRDGCTSRWPPCSASGARSPPTKASARSPPPLVARVVLALGWLAAAAAGWIFLRGRPIGALLAGVIVLTIVAFPFPVRSEPYTVRFLTPIVLPLAVLAAAGAVRMAGPARAWLLVAPLCAAPALDGRAAPRGVAAGRTGGARSGLRARARRPARATPRRAPTPRTTPRIASPTRAGRRSWRRRPGTSGSGATRCRTSTRSAPPTAWPGSSSPAWTSGSPRRTPSRRRSPASAAASRARTRRRRAIYFDFVAPVHSARRRSGRWTDRPGTETSPRAWSSHRARAVFTVGHPHAVAGVTLLAGTSAPVLPRAMDLEVSSDGTTFERIGRRRRGRETVDLAWVNGHPQFLVDDLAFSAPLDGRVVARRAHRCRPNRLRGPSPRCSCIRRAARKARRRRETRAVCTVTCSRAAVTTHADGRSYKVPTSPETTAPPTAPTRPEWLRVQHVPATPALRRSRGMEVAPLPGQGRGIRVRKEATCSGRSSRSFSLCGFSG